VRLATAMGSQCDSLERMKRVNSCPLGINVSKSVGRMGVRIGASWFSIQAAIDGWTN
jgi:hypothetical protein